MSKSNRKKITTQQIRETEIRNLAANTQATASVLRSDASQNQNKRTTEQATRRSVSAGPTIRREPQTDTGTTQSVAPLMFDMAVDDIADTAMEEEGAVMQAARGEEDKTKSENKRNSRNTFRRRSQRFTIYTTISGIIKQLEA